MAERPNLYDRPIFGSGPPKGAAPVPSTPRPRRRLSLNVKLLLFVVVVLTALGIAAALWLRPEEDVYVLDTFQYTTVGVRDFRSVIHSSGRVVPREIVELKASANATVASISHRAGDDVKAGALLALLGSDQLAADLAKARLEHEIALIEADQARLNREKEVAAARDQVARAQEALTEAQGKLPLMEELYALGGISRMELEEAKKEVDVAALALARAQEGLALAERQGELAVKKAEQQEANARVKVADLEKLAAELEVVAPADARVLEVLVSPGVQVQPGTALFRLADVNAQYVETSVTPEQATQVKPGAPALIRTVDAQYPARVEQVSPLAMAASSGTEVPVRLAIDPEVSALFLPNAPVSVEIELGELKDRPFLPRGPFFTSGNASFVYVLNEDHTRAERRDVRYGAIDGDYVEVLSGLSPGEQVIYSSYLAFRSYRSIDVIAQGGRRL